MTWRSALWVVVVALWLDTALAVDIKGKVVAPAGVDPSAWRIAAMAEPAAELPAGQATAAVAKDGSFTLTNVTLGGMWAVPYLGGLMDVDAMPPARLAKADDFEITVSAPRTELAISVIGPRRAALGRPLTAHLCGPFGRYDGSRGGTPVAADGTLTYRGLPAGHYTLWVDTVHGAASATEAAAVLTKDLEVTSGAGAQRVKVELPAAGALRGKLVLGAGQGPAAGWTISTGTGGQPAPGDKVPEAAYAAGAVQAYAWAPVAADGSFQLGQLPEGPVQLDVRRPGESQAWTSFEAEVKPDAVTDLGQLTVGGEGWRYLFNGRDLSNWKKADMTGGKPPWVASGRLFLPVGDDLSGILYAGPKVPRTNYELTIQGMRTEGNDFWCGLTFPVGESAISLIMGGWGGVVTGLSSIDGEDASQNSTTTMVEYSNFRWYRARVRVTPERIRCWMDDKPIIDQEIGDHKISVRWEVEPTVPFGMATWRTTGAVRDLRLRALPGN